MPARRRRAAGRRCSIAAVRRVRGGVRSPRAVASATPRSFRGRANCCSCCASMRGRGADEPRDMALVTLRAMALGGHARSPRRRFSPLLGRRRLARAALREDALRPGAAGAGLPRGGAGDRRPVLRRRGADTLAYVAPRPDRRRRRLLLRRRRRQRAAGAGRRSAAAQDGGRLLHLAATPRLATCSARTPSVFRRRFGVRPDGNAPFDPQDEFTGKNLLYTARRSRTWRRRTGSPVGEVAGRARARPRWRCSSAASQRPRPHLDDKVLTAWNGLMIAAFARAGRVLDDGERLPRGRAPRRAASSGRACGTRPPARCCAATGRGDAGVDGYAEDYAYLIFGLLELFQADGDPAWLEWALDAAAAAGRTVLGSGDGGWFSTTGA